jgi:hypothetical protein
VWADIGTRWGIVFVFKFTGSSHFSLRMSAVSNVVPNHSNIIPAGLVQPLKSDKFIWPSLGEISCMQLQFSNISDISGFTNEDDLYISPDRKIWLPFHASDLQLRILIIAHCGINGHRGMTATANAVSS